jgi:predicted nuclease with RNAse H fold
MNSIDSVYIGIDPASGNKEFSYAVLDANLNLVTLSDADMHEMVAFLSKQDSAFVAVNAPAQVNQGLVKKKLEDERSIPGRTLRGVDIRLAEYELHERGIAVTGTPSREEFCPAWMQVGFALYQKLADIGFKPFGVADAACQVLETHPYACFCVLVDGTPLPKSTLEGRLQRQLILYDKGLRITDAMRFFEEITRFKLMKGILPTDVLYSPEQLDVLVAAYTAWLAANRPHEVTGIGDSAEGKMILPAKELKEKY